MGTGPCIQKPNRSIHRGRSIKNKNVTSETDLRQLNFQHQDIPWKRINQIIKEIKWNEIFEGRCNEECTDIFTAIIKQLCLMLINTPVLSTLLQHLKFHSKDTRQSAPKSTIPFYL